MPDPERHRFIAFVSRREEMREYIEMNPTCDFDFTSFSPLGADVVCINPQNLYEAVNAFSAMHRERPFTAVLNRKEKCVIPASRLALALGLPPLSRNPEVARDKYRMRKLLNSSDDHPRTTLIRASTDLGQIEASMFPCVVKPRFGFNSRSAVMVTDKDQLETVYAEQYRLYSQLPKQDGTSADFVVEEFIPGSEHTIETLVKDGRPLFHLLSDKLAMTPPFFVEIGDNMPTCLAPSRQATCITAVERAISLMEISNGWAHTEIKLDGCRAVVIECAARMGGGYFERLFHEVYGINRMQMLIALFLGCEIPPTPSLRTYAAARRVVVYGPLRWRDLTSAHDLFQATNLILLWPESSSEISRELAGPPFEFSNTLCEFLALGSSPEAAQQLADHCLLRAHSSLT